MSITSSGAMPHCLSSASRLSTTPRATPSAAVWVVGTLDRPTRRSVAASTATACVNVPPTSMPIRILRRSGTATPYRAPTSQKPKMTMATIAPAQTGSTV